MKKLKLAIIGLAEGQRQLCEKAQEMPEVETFGIAWEQGAVCKDLVDHFIPISVVERDKIVDFCKKEGINGVVTNASEITTLTSSYVAEQLGLIGTPYQTIINIQDKEFVRERTYCADIIGQIKHYVLSYHQIKEVNSFPCVIKPTRGSAKKGVNFISSKQDLEDLLIPDDLKESTFICEEYITGREVSVESLSFHGKHYVIQITDKITSGSPHFVELGHLQPTNLRNEIVEKIHKAISYILNAVDFTNGAAHTEMKITEDGEIYLIEINPRGGGDMISNRLVEMSTNCDFVSEMINVALNRFLFKSVNNIGFSGVYFICAQNSHILSVYNKRSEYPFIIESEYDGEPLKNSTSNYERNGYILMKSKDIITLQ